MSEDAERRNKFILKIKHREVTHAALPVLLNHQNFKFTSEEKLTILELFIYSMRIQKAPQILINYFDIYLSSNEGLAETERTKLRLRATPMNDSSLYFESYLHDSLFFFQNNLPLTVGAVTVALNLVDKKNRFMYEKYGTFGKKRSIILNVDQRIGFKPTLNDSFNLFREQKEDIRSGIFDKSLRYIMWPIPDHRDGMNVFFFVMVDIEANSIASLDSSDLDHHDRLEQMKDWYKIVSESRGLELQERKVNVCSHLTPEDSGVLLLCFMDVLSDGVALDVVKPEHVQFYRLLYATSIICNSLPLVRSDIAVTVEACPPCRIMDAIDPKELTNFHNLMTEGGRLQAMEDLANGDLAPDSKGQVPAPTKLPEFDTKVTQLIRTDHVTMRGLSRLRIRTWLSDQVINCTFILLQQRDQLQCTLSHAYRRHSHFVDNSFMDKLYINFQVYDFDRAATCTRRIPNFFEMDKFFAPCFVNGNHWTLVMVSIQEKRIVYYDSFHHGNTGIGDTILFNIHQFLVELATKYSVEQFATDWQTLHSKYDTPQQNNSDDCGVFVIMLAFCLCGDLENHYLTPDYIPFFREFIGTNLLRAKLKHYV